ncbi:MAG: hypothetical protein JSS31_09600 [Proteobacteria bacterium]|nr:hypothetical protein [Pseudomonadota bacterium]MBS0494191.1 hypothetical protein [Pseudomonadota bacterium]
MPYRPLPLVLSAAAVLAACAPMSAKAPGDAAPMGFFVTSSNPGRGADLGGLAGADRYCQALANGVGAGGRTWRAYLSTVATAASPAVNARDRIGAGPWYNARGVLIARNVDELHRANHIDKQTALTEKGEVVSGVGDAVNMHDMLTGSLPDGRASSAAGETTCGNWTHDGAGSALLGHHDRTGLDDSEAAHSWNSSHASRGCGMEALKSTGGAGLFYCFAADTPAAPAGRTTGGGAGYMGGGY